MIREEEMRKWQGPTGDKGGDQGETLQGHLSALCCPPAPGIAQVSRPSVTEQ